MTKTCNIILTLLMLVSCKVTAQSSFEYRSIYSPTNEDPGFRLQHKTHHVDFDWDLWGHAMKKIVGDNPDNSVWSTVNDTLCNKQFCFSSEKLYNAIVDYILDQFGEGSDSYSARICIMPQDNKISCTCSKCRKEGNTSTNATPAVTKMVCKLAKRFPKHQFFTSAYNSTLTPPSNPLPDNVGVLISASHFQLRVDFSNAKGYETFVENVKAWKKNAKTVYVWDYARNFNDYLSPFPCLYVMQSRLRLYRDLGINGVFINGSGYDYSSFDDVQTTVLASLLNDPDINIDDAVKDYFRKYYPITASLLSDYYLRLEHRMVETNHHLPLYSENMKEVETSYLKADEFTAWRAELDKASKKTSKAERTRLNYLLTALSFTQLRLIHNGFVSDSELEAEMKAILKGHTELKRMEYYSEDGGLIKKEY